MKLKCVKAIQIGDGKQKQPFANGQCYEAFSVNNVPSELFVIGDREKLGGGNWQAVAAFPSGWVVLGVAIFDEVKE